MRQIKYLGQGFTLIEILIVVTILMILAVTLLIGNFIADLLLAWSDPRIQFDD